MAQRQPRQIVYETPISKITRARWTRAVAQVVEHLLCKHEAEFKHQSHQRGKKKSEQITSIHMVYSR
jgi:hypothetical protein